MSVNEKSSILFTLSQASGIKMSFFLARQNFLKYILYILYTYIYRRFSTTLNEDLRKNNNKEMEKLENIK